MSTKKEKCCEVCESPNGCITAFIGQNCPCHQSESIEWEKEFDERFTLTLFGSGIGEPIFPHGLTPKEIKDFIAQAITTAVAKAGKKAYAEGFEDGCKAH